MGADANGARYVLADDVVRGGGMRLYREGDAAWDDGWDDGWDDDAKTDDAKTDDAKTTKTTDEATDSDARPPRPRISPPHHPFYVEDESSVVFLDDVPCMCCGRVDDEATFVLCDACPNGGHLACLGLERVPTGYWSCAVCASRRRAPVRPSPGPGSWEVVATDPEELAAVGARLTASGDATTLGAALSRDVADDVAAKFEREATRRAKKEAKAMRRANEEAKAAASAAAREETRRRRAKRSAWWMCRRTEPGTARARCRDIRDIKSIRSIRTGARRASARTWRICRARCAGGRETRTRSCCASRVPTEDTFGAWGCGDCRRTRGRARCARGTPRRSERRDAAEECTGGRGGGKREIERRVARLASVRRREQSRETSRRAKRRRLGARPERERRASY